jgi:transposase
MIAARILDPASKLATARGLDTDTAVSALGDLLGIESADENDLYCALDWLLARQPHIEKKLARMHLPEDSFALYDVTSTYVEGRHCPLAGRGHCRDKKKGKLQIVYGVLCNRQGCPVAVEVFPGNTGDPSTLSTQIEKIRNRFGLENIVLVGDRGMITQARINKELRGRKGLDWITALRGPAIAKLIEDKALQPSLFDQTDLAEITSLDYPDERLIACHNPLLAHDRERKRKELIACTARELDKIVLATKRSKRALRGENKIAMRVGKVINKFKVAKYFELEITHDSFAYEPDADRIGLDRALDGIYIVRTSVSPERLSSEETVQAYKSLSEVEKAFRTLKTLLKVRPIHHRLEDRVRAHIFMCTLAYYVEWHMRRKLAPILFEDDDQETAEALRHSVVAPARRSPRAVRKAQTKTTDDGTPVHSFSGVMANLATIVKNRIQPKLAGIEPFHKVTLPSRFQQKVLDLLGVKL